MKCYKTVEAESNIEVTIEKSRFIGYAKPISTKEEGQEFVKNIKKIHKDATHNVPAIVVGKNFEFQWASDDGEPQGTSGAPILKMLCQEGVTDIALVVTRYFGGIKLGTGGLVRAYTSVAKRALEKARIVEYKSKMLITIKYPYTLHGKVEGIVRKSEVRVEDIVYLENITMELLLDFEEEKNLVDLIEAIPAIKILKKETVFRGIVL